MTHYIEVSDYQSVRQLCLNDPASLNSLSECLATELSQHLTAAQDDAEVRAVVLTGSGKTFCSGGNLKEFLQVAEPLDEYIQRLITDLYTPLAMQIRNFPKPIITALNGAAIGAGVGLALGTDMVFAARSAYFALPFVPALAVVPDMGSSWLVPRALGYSRALALALTGEKFSAEQAQAAGMIWKCVADAELEQVVRASALKLAALPQRAMLRTKAAFSQAHENTFAQQLDLECVLQTESFGGTEFQEGLHAFKQRRAPDFSKV